MLRKLGKLGPFLLAAVLAAAPFPALSQETGAEEAAEAAPERGAWGFYAGFLSGSEVTNGPIFGSRPELDDAATIGGVYSYNSAPRWLLEARFGLSSTTVLDAPDDVNPGVDPPREVDATLFYLDIALIPTIEFGDFTLGFPFGVGWASLSEDGVLSPSIPGRSSGLMLEGGNGAQYFAGVQGRWRTGGRWSVFADARVHRFHRLTNVIEQNTTAPELTIGFLRHF